MRELARLLRLCYIGNMMHVFTERILREFAEERPDVKSALKNWYKLMDKGKFNNFAELREMFPTADMVGGLTVFNVDGNKVRVITDIHYNRQIVYIRAVLTHAEYDKNKWKE